MDDRHTIRHLLKHLYSKVLCIGQPRASYPLKEKTNSNIYWQGGICVGFQLYAKNNSDNKAQLWHFILMMKSIVNKMSAVISTDKLQNRLEKKHLKCVFNSSVKHPFVYECVLLFHYSNKQTKLEMKLKCQGVVEYCLNLILKEDYINRNMWKEKKSWETGCCCLSVWSMLRLERWNKVIRSSTHNRFDLHWLYCDHRANIKIFPSWELQIRHFSSSALRGLAWL